MKGKGPGTRLGPGGATCAGLGPPNVLPIDLAQAGHQPPHLSPYKLLCSDLSRAALPCQWEWNRGCSQRPPPHTGILPSQQCCSQTRWVLPHPHVETRKAWFASCLHPEPALGPPRVSPRTLDTGHGSVACPTTGKPALVQLYCPTALLDSCPPLHPQSYSEFLSVADPVVSSKPRANLQAFQPHYGAPNLRCQQEPAQLV